MACSIVFLGASRVGKSSLLSLHLGRERTSSLYDSTVQDDYQTAEVINGRTVEVTWIDTGGDNEFEDQLPEWISKGTGFVLMFNLEDKSTISYVKKCKALISENSKLNRPMLLVGNLVSGLVKNRKISQGEASGLATELNLPYVECATETKQNCDKVISAIVGLSLRPSPTADSRTLATPKRDSSLHHLVSWFKHRTTRTEKKDASVTKRETTAKKGSEVKHKDNLPDAKLIKPKQLFASPLKEAEGGRALTIVLMGAERVGKSMFLRRYMGKPMTEDIPYDSTVEDQVDLAETIGGRRVVVSYLDTGGHGQCAEMVPEWVDKGNGFILFFDVTNRVSFARIQQLRDMIQKRKESKTPTVVVGNIVNAGGVRRKVQASEGKSLATSLNGVYLELSSKDDKNIKAFQAVIELFGKSAKPKATPTFPGTASKDKKLKKKVERTTYPQGTTKMPDFSEASDSDVSVVAQVPTTPTTKTLISTPKTAKISILGSPCVGKSYMLSQHMGKKSESKEYDSTIEDRYTKHEIVDGEDLMVEYLDTGGSEECSEMLPGWMQESDGHLFVFRTEDRPTFEQVKTLRKLSPLKPAVLIANTVDPTQRKISSQETTKLAASLRCGVVEISTSEGSRIPDAFAAIVTKVTQERKGHSSLITSTPATAKKLHVPVSGRGKTSR